MPNRIIREGILTSDRVNQLGPHAEIFYRRLLSVVDDFGRYDARESMLRVACYPLRVDVVREADISRWLAEVQSAGLIALYAVNGKQFLEVVEFNQQIRAKSSKWPSPDEGLPIKCSAYAKHVHSRRLASDTQEMASAHLVGDGDGDGDGDDRSYVQGSNTTSVGSLVGEGR